MFKKKAKKTGFKERPGPPTAEQIHEDIKNASDADVAFTLFGDTYKHIVDEEPSSPCHLMIDSYEDEESIPLPAKTSKFSHDISDDQSSQESNEHQNTEDLYIKAMQFLKLNKSLKTAPSELKKQFERLEVLGYDLTESIDKLKEQMTESPSS